MKNTYYILIICLVAFLYSCEDAVDIQPNNIIVGDATSVNSIGAARQMINGAYPNLSSNPLSFGDLSSNNAKIAPTNTGQGVASFSWTYTENDNYGSWVGQYAALRNINVVLSVIDDFEANTDKKEAEKLRIKAEALAQRAFTHFTLMQQYSPKYDVGSALGVPIQTKPITASQQPARNTVAEVYAQIESDILASIENFTASKEKDSSAKYEVDFFSEASVYALASRVALTKGEWAKAGDFASKSINAFASDMGGAIATRSQYATVWRNDSQTAGIILSQLRGAKTYVSTYNRVTNADIFYFSSNELYNLYQDGDIRKSFNFEKLNEGQYKMVKWPALASQPAIDGKIFRVEEMYLTLAEASARTGDLAKAAEAVNAIRKNRIDGYSDIQYENAETAISDVLKERRLELAFEGFHFFDLKRLGLPVERQADDCSSSNCSLDADSYLFTFPIPQNEMRANVNMVQNPNY